MFKINKYTNLRRCFPHLLSLRSSCSKECPPRYECVQPKPSEYEMRMKEMTIKNLTPLIFKPVCPKDYKTHKNLFLFVCLPIICCIYLDMYYIHPQKLKRPKFVPFSHLRIRNKPYPWDPVRTLFHNPEVNALPDGYETEFPEEDETDPFQSDPYAVN